MPTKKDAKSDGKKGSRLVIEKEDVRALRVRSDVRAGLLDISSIMNLCTSVTSISKQLQV